MAEITAKRTYRSKTIDNGDGSFTLNSHMGHIHYDNKLGVGDGVKGLRSLDWTLIWDGNRRGWTFEYHSFHPLLPEYADEWIEFRDIFDGKDQIVRWRAVAQHVKGRLVADVPELKTGANAIIYDNAFGKGVDLILAFSRSALKKLVRIREGYYPAVDTSYDFEVQFPQGSKVYRGYDYKDPAYELDTTKDKTFDTDKYTFIGLDQGDGKQWFTFLRPFQIWDCVRRIRRYPKRQIINVDYKLSDGKGYLRKNIPASFFVGAEGDVFTDASATYYTDSGDGDVDNTTPGGWSNCRDASTGSANGSASTATLAVGQWDGDYWNSRGFLPFADTANLDDSAVISAASIYVYFYAAAQSGGNYVAICDSSQAATNALVSGDYDETTFTTGSDTHAISGLSTSAYTEFVLTSTGRGWIDATGDSFFTLLFEDDITDTSYTPNQAEDSVDWYPSERTGTSEDPYISITYTVPGRTTKNSDSWAHGQNHGQSLRMVA